MNVHVQTFTCGNDKLLGGSLPPGERGLRSLKFNGLLTRISAVTVEQLRSVRSIVPCLAPCGSHAEVVPQGPEPAQSPGGGRSPGGHSCPVAGGWRGRRRVGNPRPASLRRIASRITPPSSSASIPNFLFILMAPHFNKAGDSICQKTTTLLPIISMLFADCPFQ